MLFSSKPNNEIENEGRKGKDCKTRKGKVSKRRKRQDSPTRKGRKGKSSQGRKKEIGGGEKEKDRVIEWEKERSFDKIGFHQVGFYEVSIERSFGKISFRKIEISGNWGQANVKGSKDAIAEITRELRKSKTSTRVISNIGLQGEEEGDRKSRKISGFTFVGKVPKAWLIKKK